MRLIWTLTGIASAVTLLRLLKCILSPDQNDEEQPLDDNNITRTADPPIHSKPTHSYDTVKDPLLYRLDSRGKLKPTDVASHGRGNLYSSAGSSQKPTTSTPFSSSSSSSSSVIRVSSNPASKTSPAPVSSTNINNSAIKLSVGPEKTPFSSSVTRVSSNPVSKPSPALVSSTNINTSAIKLSVGPEKLQITKDSASATLAQSSKKQSSAASIRESQKNVYSASLSSIKAPTLDSSSFPETTPEHWRSSKRVLSRYEIPKNLEEMIKKDIVPPILKCPLSPLTYADYFATLLYAEDFYLEKWSKYLLKDVVLELRPREDHNRVITVKRKDGTPGRKDFIASSSTTFQRSVHFFFQEILSSYNCEIPPSNHSRNVVLVEFGNDFHWQHSPSKRYDVSFSFNRVCLKRAHQAISISADPSFHSILFPDRSPSPQLHDRISSFQDPARRIANHRGPIPFLLQGQLVTEKSPTGRVLQLAMLNIYRANPGCRILICSPTNNTSDVLLRSLRERIPEASFFRANAAFRNYDLVPDDIVPASLYKEEQECFSCPPLSELLTFNIVTCTFMSSFRLSSAGIDSDHFSHIFLVDACLAIEPEAIIPLANLACRDTALVVTGCLDKSPEWVRSEIARRNGLKESYFSRLLRREPYQSGDSMFILQIRDC